MLLLAALSASLAAAPAPPTLAAARVTLTGIYNQRGEAYLHLVVTELQAAGLVVITPARARELLGDDRQEDLYACEEDREGCSVALGKALEAEGVVLGSIVRGDLQTGHRVLLQLLSSTDGHPLFTFYEAGVDEGALKATMQRAARLLAGELGRTPVARLQEQPLTRSVTTRPLLRKIGWGFLALGAAGAVTTAVSLGHRLEILNQPKPEHPIEGTLEPIWREAEQLRRLGIGTAVVSGLALATFGALLGAGLAELPVEPVIALSPTGAMGGLTLRF